MLDKKESGFQVYFEIVRAAAPDLAKKEASTAAATCSRSKDFEEAERVLRLVQRDDLASPEGDLALAIAQLRQQRLDPTSAGRDQGNAISLFLKLSRKEGFNLLKQLEKDAALVSPEGLLYLGFAFTERQGADRDLGGAILKLVAKKFGSKEEGKIAKQKLKTQGSPSRRPSALITFSSPGIHVLARVPRVDHERGVLHDPRVVVGGVVGPRSRRRRRTGAPSP
jgi:hypothetical protein